MNFLHIPVWFQKRHLLLKKKNLRQHLKVAQHELRFYLVQGIKACVSQLNAASSDTDM